MLFLSFVCMRVFLFILPTSTLTLIVIFIFITKQKQNKTKQIIETFGTLVQNTSLQIHLVHSGGNVVSPRDYTPTVDSYMNHRTDIQMERMG